MDHEKYYNKRHDGSYIIHFPNQGLSSNEVKNIFSAYGEVLSIEQRGDDFGLCFVRYKYLNDTIHCLNSLKNHKSIRILPHRNKFKNVPTPKNSTSVGKKKTGSFVSTPIMKFQNHNHSQNNDENGTDDTDNYKNTSSRSITNNDSHKSSKRIISSLKQMAVSKQLERAASSSPISSDCYDKSSNVTENSFNEDEIPSLICTKSKLTNHVSKYYQVTPRVIPAEEVIVANVHHELGTREILSFFHEYNPIAASRMFQIPNIGIKYCHIYFESNEQAVAVEKKFDKYYWYGRNLIVLRLHVLAEQALLI